MDTFFRCMVGGVVLLLAVIGFLFVMSTPVNAHTLTPDECVLQAKDIGLLHDRKMTGVTWEVAKLQITKEVVEALSHGDTYIKDREDVARILNMAEYIWANDHSRSDYQMSAWYGCLMKYNAESI